MISDNQEEYNKNIKKEEGNPYEYCFIRTRNTTKHRKYR